MRFRHAAAVLAFAAACVAVSYGAALLRSGRPSARAAVDLPVTGLVLAAGGADLEAALASLDVSPFWSSALRGGAAARRFVEPGPGALGIYGKGWLVLGSRPGEAEPPAFASYGPWHAAASAPERLPRAGTPSLTLALPRGAAAVAWTPSEGARSSAAASWRGTFPVRAVGLVDAVSGRERWRLVCEGPCLLDALRPEAADGDGDLRWAALPADPVAVAEVSFDPSRLGSALDSTAIEAVERFLGLPLRADLAKALAGRAVIALIEEPRSKAPAALLVALDLASSDAARSLVERVLALGILSGEVNLERYRDVTVGAWRHPGGRSDLRPAVAVDGDVLLVATSKRDLLSALDRRRARGGADSPARAALASLGPSAWRGWSRSSFLCTGWLEFVTGFRADTQLPAQEVAARLVRRDGAWMLESRGAGPAFAAEPLLPAARSLMRAARAPG